MEYVRDDEDEDDDDEGLTAIPIAPDDLHKADTSGGDPYEMAVPDPVLMVSSSTSAISCSSWTIFVSRSRSEGFRATTA